METLSGKFTSLIPQIDFSSTNYARAKISRFVKAMYLYSKVPSKLFLLLGMEKLNLQKLPVEL